MLLYIVEKRNSLITINCKVGGLSGGGMSSQVKKPRKAKGTLYILSLKKKGRDLSGEAGTITAV